MQYIKHEEPEGSFSKGFERTMRELSEGLAQNLFQRRQRQETAMGLRAMMPNMSPERASLMSGMDPQMLSTYLKQEMLSPSRQANYKLMQQMFGGGQEGQQPGGQMPMEGQGQNVPMDGMPGASGLSTSGLPEMEGGQLTDQQFNNLLRIKSKEQSETRKMQHQDFVKSYDNIKKESEGLSKEIELAKTNSRDLKTLKTLNRTGKLIQGPKRALLEKWGWQDVYTNAPTQLADKIVNGINTKAIQGYKIGGRFTNQILQSIQRQNPSLLNNQIGFDGVIENRLIEEDSVAALNKAKKDVISYYKNKRMPLPEDWREQAYKKVEKRLDANGMKMLDNVWKVYYKDKGITNPEDIYKKFPTKGLQDGKHVEWHKTIYELVNGKWIPVPGWKPGDGAIYAEES